jgi:hypothetical protein
MGEPARHREPARSGEAGGPPGNRPAVPRDWFPYLNGTSQGPTPEDARKYGQISGRSKLFMKYSG